MRVKLNYQPNKTMNKFKIGDKVRITEVTSSDVATGRCAVGDVLTVDEDSFCPWCIDKNGKRIAVDEDQAELVTKNKTMKNITVDGVEYTPVQSGTTEIEPGQVWRHLLDDAMVITDDQDGYTYLEGGINIVNESSGCLYSHTGSWEYIGLASKVITINK